MSELYTCKCGNQTWKIYGLMMECTECGTQYRVLLPSGTIRDNCKEDLENKENRKRPE